MKTMKTILGITITVLLFMVGSSAQAAFRCQASNNHGQAWFAVAGEQWEARRAAMRACRMQVHRHSCRVDYCNFTGRRHFEDRHHDRYDRHHDRHYRHERRDDGIRIDLR